MVVCYKFLYKQKKENESDLDRLSRRLSFKFPVVLRYSLALPMMFGLIHSALARNFKFIRFHLFTIPLYMMGLCYEEVYQFYCIQTGQPVVWRYRGKNLYEEQQREKKRLAQQAEHMKVKGKVLSEQLDKPINAEL